MKKIVYRGYRKVIVMMISFILAFQISPKVFANDKNSSEVGQPVYYIETAEDFNNIRTTPGAIYILMNDIDLKQYENWKPISNFSGILDGRGNTISGLQINKGLQTNADLNNLGLFGINTGTIEHLIVKKPKISCEGAMAGSTNIGAIAGKNLGQIQDILVEDVNVDMEDKALGGKIVGGLVGNNMGTIEYCHVTGKIKGMVIGGLVGKNWITREKLVGVIENSSYIGIIESSNYMGGIVGNNVGKIENCFSQACFKVPSGKKASYAGGIAGDNEGDVNYCYARVWIEEGNGGIEGKISGVAPVGKDYLNGTLFYDKDIMGLSPNTKSGEGKSTAQMKQKETYVEMGWNFKSIWKIVDGEGYPSLREPGDIEDSGEPGGASDIEDSGEAEDAGDIEDSGEAGDAGDIEDSGEAGDAGDIEDSDEAGDAGDIEDSNEPGDAGGTENPGESGDPVDIKEPGESGGPVDIKEPRDPGEPGDTENPSKSDKTEDKGSAKEENVENTIKNPTYPSESDLPKRENTQKTKNQRQSVAVKLEEPQVVEDEKELTAYFINTKNIDLIYLREGLVRYHPSEAPSQILKTSKPFGILTWVSKYHIL